jgi:hypothetical protein
MSRHSNFTRVFASAFLASIIAPLGFAAPTTQPAPPSDNALNDILSHATTAPADAPDSSSPTSQPASPFDTKKAPGRQGTITLSNGEKISGRLTHTGNKPLRMWVEKDQEYHDIPFEVIQHIEAKVLWERDEKEWHFKESGSDIKEFTGKTYPVRETAYTLTLINGQTLTGGIVEPIYLARKEGPATFSLLKRDKGDVGKTLKELVYVARVDFDDAKKGN